MENINILRIMNDVVEHLTDDMTDADALNYSGLFLTWETSTLYHVGDRVRYNDTLYKCLTEHSSQDYWTPDVSPSLWVRVDDPSIEWPEWIQPVGSTDAYAKDAKVSHNEKHWISDTDGNVWEPGVAMWHEATE